MITHQQIWNSLPDPVSNDWCGQIGGALAMGGHKCVSKQAMGLILVELVAIARDGDTGPLTREQKIKLAIEVWEWCIGTARGGLSQ